MSLEEKLRRLDELRRESELDGLDPDQLVHRIITAWRGTA